MIFCSNISTKKISSSIKNLCKALISFVKLSAKEPEF